MGVPALIIPAAKAAQTAYSAYKKYKKLKKARPHVSKKENVKSALGKGTNRRLTKKEVAKRDKLEHEGRVKKAVAGQKKYLKNKKNSKVLNNSNSTTRTEKRRITKNMDRYYKNENTKAAKDGSHTAISKQELELWRSVKKGAGSSKKTRREFEKGLYDADQKARLRNLKAARVKAGVSSKKSK